jgi:hypothetical protein
LKETIKHFCLKKVEGIGDQGQSINKYAMEEMRTPGGCRRLSKSCVRFCMFSVADAGQVLRCRSQRLLY